METDNEPKEEEELEETLDPIVRLDNSKILWKLIEQGDKILSKLDDLPNEYKAGKTSKLNKYVSMYVANQKAIAMVSRWVLSSDRWYYNHLTEYAKQIGATTALMLSASPLGDPLLSLVRLREFESSKDPAQPIKTLISTLLSTKLPPSISDLLSNWITGYISPQNKEKGGKDDRV
jgi:hypothetical protein